MAKMGRPKSDDPMNYRFTIRFSNAEQKQLEAYAEKYDLKASLSTFNRSGDKTFDQGFL